MMLRTADHARRESAVAVDSGLNDEAWCRPWDLAMSGKLIIRWPRRDWSRAETNNFERFVGN